MKVFLEFGGKLLNIIFVDVDFEIVVDYVLFGIFVGSG